MNVAGLLKALRAVGVSEKQLLDAVEIMEEERLAKGRAATAKWRNSKRNGDITHITHITPSLSPEKRKVSPDPSKETQPLSHPSTPSGVERARAGRIPPDYRPNLDAAVAEGLSRAQAEREASIFVDYFLAAPGEKGLKRDWAATWRNWFRRAAESSTGPPDGSRNRTHNRAGGNGHVRQSGSQQAIEELDRRAAERAARRKAAGEGDFFSGETIDASYVRRR